MARSRNSDSLGPVVWRHFLIGQSFGASFALVLFAVEPVWLMRAVHDQFGASLWVLLAVYATFGWVVGAATGVVFGMAGALPRLRRADGTVPGLGPFVGFALMGLFILRMESARTVGSLQTTVVVSLAAAALVWVGLGFLGRRFLARYLPVASRPLALRLSALTTVLAVTVSAGIGAVDPTHWRERAPAPAGAPNVVLVVVNALRPDHLSLYGYDRVTSPNLDRFASSAAVFENAYSHGIRLGTAVPSLLTSLHPPFIDAGPRRPVSMAEFFRDGGYRTVCLAGKGTLDAVAGWDSGYDAVDRFDAARFRLSVYRALAIAGLVRPPTHPPNSPDAAAVAERGIEWLRSIDDEPLFLTMFFEDLEPPYHPPARHVRAVAPVVGDIDDRVLFAKTAAMAAGTVPVRLADGELDRLVDLYDAGVRNVDEGLGRFLVALESGGLERETVVVITADRGTEFMEQGSLINSKLASEAAIRVPLMVGREPPRGAGRTVGSVVRHVDLLPTLAELAGSVSPPGVQGTSLVPELSGARAPRGRVAVAEGGGSVSVVKDHWKVLYLEASGEYRFYDLAVDRLGRNAAYAGGKADMVALVGEYRDLQAGVPVVNGKLAIGSVTP